MSVQKLEVLNFYEYDLTNNVQFIKEEVKAYARTVWTHCTI